MEFNNVDKFESWLKEKLNSKCYDLQAFLDDVDRSYGVNGMPGTNTYELESYRTKSGRPELYYYDVKEIYHKDDKVVEPCDDFDYVDVICIF